MTSENSETMPVELHEVPAPPEPRIAYPEPHLWTTGVTALVHGKTFLASDLAGNVVPPGHPNVGFFFDDTRYLSYLQLKVNGHPPVVLSSNSSDGNSTRVEMTPKGSIHGSGLDMPVNAVYMRREQVLEGRVLHDVLYLHNFHVEKIRLTVEYSFDADFMDIFQVRGIVRGKSGTYYAPVQERDSSVFVYEGLDNKLRSTTVRFDPPPAQMRENCSSWTIELPPLGRSQIRIRIVPRIADKTPHVSVGEFSRMEVSPAAPGQNLESALEELQDDLDGWLAECSRFSSDNDIFDAMLQTSIRDFYALQIRQPAGKMIAAGIPWFATLFGRDSLIASFETLILNSELAKGTLRVLAAFQGNRSSDERDEDPGKILHELRSGEMTNTGEVAFGRNYGSVDATPLFVILLSEYFRWAGDMDFLVEMKPHLRTAVDWLLDYGDLDGDGLIEYCRRSPKGLFNQGWKDSGDAIQHADGRIAQPPIALVEVQGYAIDAFARASSLFSLLGSHGRAETLQKKSQNLRVKLNQAFWMRDEGFYALALDREKHRVAVKASNPGHLLFSNAIEHGRAREVMSCLMDQDLNAGWGIRTLSQAEKTFNPMSYHRGSVWPHDNAIAAYGMALYGFHAESAQVLSSLYESAMCFRDYRLPELFCGIQRGRSDDPVHYPVSCSPQAWASGAMFLILTGLLGIRPDAHKREVKVINPHLPHFLNKLSIDELRVGKSRIWLEFLRRDGRTFCNVTRHEGEQISISVVYQ